MVVRKYTMVHKDGELESWDEPHGGTRVGRFLNRTPKLIQYNGEPFVLLRGGAYHVTGAWNTFHYRVARSLWLFKHMGLQKLWVEGDPSPFYLSRSRESTLRDTAEAIRHMMDSDIPERVLRPRKHDWTLILLVAVTALSIGVAIGGRLR